MINKLKTALQNSPDTSVFYFACTDEAPLEEAVSQLKEALYDAASYDEPIRFEGQNINFGEVITACGTPSFLGEKRIVYIHHLSPSSLKDADVKELCELFGEVLSAVLIISALYKDKKTATSKKAKTLFSAAENVGYAALLTPFTARDNTLFAQGVAQSLGASFAPKAADMLISRVGQNRLMLRHETEKLAAACGYAEITTELVQSMSCHNIEADVFELARLICDARRSDAQKKLASLLELRQEPVAISAALATNFTDMYRTALAAKAGRKNAQLAKDFGYSGGEWRLQKAAQNARRYTYGNLKRCVLTLHKLDMTLKSSAVSDKGVFLQAAVCELIALGESGWKS